VKPSSESTCVIAEPATGRQFSQFLGISSAKDNFVGSERRSQANHDIRAGPQVVGGSKLLI